jgi:hypothetical protein
MATIVLACDECDAVYTTPSNVKLEQAVCPQSPDFIIPGLSCSLRFPEARFATKDEIESKGWGELIVGVCE